MKPRITKNRNPRDAFDFLFRAWKVEYPNGFVGYAPTHRWALGDVRRYCERLGTQQDYAKAGQ